jgi:hypothetical protein
MVVILSLVVELRTTLRSCTYSVFVPVSWTRVGHTEVAESLLTSPGRTAKARYWRVGSLAPFAVVSGDSEHASAVVRTIARLAADSVRIDEFPKWRQCMK